jgi:hypothetical protein
MLLVNGSGATLCSFDVRTMSSHCSFVDDAGGRLAGAVDIQVAALLKGGRAGLLLLNDDSANICRVESKKEGPTLGCSAIGHVPAGVVLKVAPARGTTATEGIEIIDDTESTQREASRAAVNDVRLGLHNALKAVRKESSFQQKIEEFEENPFPLPAVEVYGWPEPADPGWDLPTPTPWFDQGHPPQTGHEIGIVNGGGYSSVEACKKFATV